MEMALSRRLAASVALFVIGALLLPGPSSRAQEHVQLIPQLGLSTVHSVTFSPDGRLVLIGCGDGTARLWETATGQQIRLFQSAAASVNAVAFSPDGRFVLTGEDDGKARLWDTATGQQIRIFDIDKVLSEYSSWVTSVVFSKDGRYVLVGIANQSATLWDVASGRLFRNFDGDGSGDAVALSPDGRYVLTGGASGTALLWDVTTGQQLRSFKGAISDASSVAFSPDGRFVLTGGRKTWLWDASTGDQIRSFDGPTGLVTSVAFSPDGRYVLGSEDKTAHLWETVSGRQIRTFGGDGSTVTSVAFSPDGSSLLTGQLASEAILWDTTSGQLLRSLKGSTQTVSAVAFSPDNHFVLTGGGDRIGHLWDPFTGSQIRTFEGHKVFLTSVAFSPDGRSVLTGSADSTARLWDVASGKELRSFKGEADWVKSVAFSPNGRFVLTGSDSVGSNSWLWDVATGNRIRSFDGQGLVMSAAFSPDGRYVLVGSKDYSARLWQADTGEKIRSFDGHTGMVTSVAFSPDGRSVLTGSSDKTARLWDLTTGRQLRSFQGHTGPVTSVAFSPDGLRVMTGSGDGQYAMPGSADNTARLWDPATGNQLQRFEGHSNEVTSVSFSSDGKFVLTGSDDTTTRLWDPVTGKQLATLLSFDRGGWAVVSPDGRFDTSALDGGAPLSWIVDDHPFKPLPLEIFMRQYYTPRLLPRLLAHEILPELPSIASLDRIQPEIKFLKVESDPNHRDALRAVISVKSRTEGAKSSGARDLRAFRDGQLVAFREGALSDGEYAFDNIRLAHKGPEQEIMLTAYVFNRDLVKSETVRPELPYKVPANWPERQGRAFLVNIGVNQTSAEGCDLHYTVTDATEMQSMLTQRLQAAGYGVEQHLLISDDTHLNGASKGRLESVLRGIAQQATPDDLFILSYSGHGYTDPQGVFYLFPSDLKGNCRAKIVDRTLMDSAISSDQLTEWIRPIDAGEMVMILDACYSAEIVEGQDFKPGPMGSRGLGQLAYDKRIRVLAASQAKQPAGEAGRLGMGYLSYALLKDGLEKKQADWQPADNFIWLREWLAWGVKHVPDLYTADPNHTQPTTEKGFQVNLQGTLPLQTPALFDFRREQDKGMLLQKVK